MKQEIHQVTQLLLQLKVKYEMSHCTQCAVMQEYLKKEYHRLKIKLQSLEKLLANYDLAMDGTFAEAQQAVGILGLYVMV